MNNTNNLTYYKSNQIKSNQIKFIHSNKHIILHGSLFIYTCCQDDAWPKFGRLPAPPVGYTIIWWYVYGG